MDTQQKYLAIYGSIVTLVVLSFFVLKRGPRPPVKLDLSAGPADAAKTKSATGGPPAKGNAAPAPQQRVAPSWASEYKPRPRSIPGIDQDADTSPGRAPQGEVSEDTGGEISLNVIFNWNGHAWDAYEVLGLPAGSSRDKVHAAFQTARGKADPESVPFLQAAYDAITRR